MLLPLLRSRAQGEVLAWIVRHPEAEFSLAEIARAVEVSQPTVMREVDRLVEAGLARQARRSRPRVWGEVSIRRVRPTVGEWGQVAGRGRTAPTVSDGVGGGGPGGRLRPVVCAARAKSDRSTRARWG